MLSFNVKYFPGNIYSNVIASCLAEMMGFILAGLMFDKLGVQKSLQFSMCVALIGGIAVLIFNTTSGFYVNGFAKSDWIFPALILLCMFGVSSGFNVCYMSNAQLFPVLFSATSIGICNFTARLSAIFAP